MMKTSTNHLDIYKLIEIPIDREKLKKNPHTLQKTQIHEKVSHQMIDEIH